MIEDLTYREDENGVHVMGTTDDEGTLCGVWNSEHNDLRNTRKKTVTCPLCIRHLKTLRRVKFAERATSTKAKQDRAL